MPVFAQKDFVAKRIEAFTLALVDEMLAAARTIIQASLEFLATAVAGISLHRYLF